ncbi:MAG: hypothetical protein IJN48_04750 [Clostridia bacterium]|nr:hypothetical protein [Clostridia bacterium]
MENKDTFKYTYSAKQQDEIKRIRKKYMADKEEDMLSQLRRLDKSVTDKANILSIIVGIIGSLVLGVGMSLAMVWEMFVLGIAVGIVGIVLLSLAYPIYKHTVKKEREKIAPEILRLTDELMK